MKKRFIPSALISFLFILVSCEKESIEQPINQFTQPDAITVPGGRTVMFASNWFYLTYDFAYDKGYYILGQYPVDTVFQYDMNEHVHLAFTRSINEDTYIRGTYNYASLPTKAFVSLGTVDGLFLFDFSLDFTVFSLSIRPFDPSAELPDPKIFENTEYRYIIVPKSIYESLTINWYDYTEVAAALGL